MTAIAAPTVKDTKSVSFGFIDSATLNSISDFIPSKLIENDESVKKDSNDFTNTFICHLIFYAFFCVSAVLHILIDLGLASFIKKNFAKLTQLGRHLVFKKNNAFA
tara:strand:- start:94 stop:411 length:318 start_codon:yes stop_codon:yes gene_type:complete